jgi:hypothetical protein
MCILVSSKFDVLVHSLVHTEGGRALTLCGFMFHVVVVLVFPCTCSWAEPIKFVENHWHLHHHMMLRFLTFTCLFNLISDRRMVHAQECKLSFKNGMSRNTGNYKTHHQGMCKSKMKSC